MKIRFPKLKRISWKLTLIYAVLFSAVLILLNVGILYGVRYFLVQQSMNQVEESINNTTRLVLGALIEHSSLSDPELLNEAQTNSDINIRIANANGEIVNQSKNFNAEKLDILSDLDTVQKIENNEKHIVYKNTGIYASGKLIAYLQVSKDMQKDYSFIKLLFILMAVADSIGMILSVLSGYIISGRMLKPIDRIAKAAREISIHDLNGRIEVGGTDDELARLAATFNDMLQRLKISFEKQNQFVSDASHELRTPISVIQGYIGLIDRWGKEDKNVLQESIEAIKSETVNMGELVEKLLFLARGDVGTLKLQKDKINLHELIEEVIRESHLIAPTHKINFSVDKDLELFADRKLIKQVLRALLDNSIKFTPDNGEISVNAESVEKSIKITVKDTGVGIADNELDHIFDRFYRVDKARTKELGGSGLGLSIVKSIVDAHEGTVRAESSIGLGTSITVVFNQ